MRNLRARWLTGGLGAVLALAFSASVVKAGNMSPASSSSLMGEVFAFVDDFGQWNTSLNNVPVEFLEIVPSANQADAVVWLFWLWLHDGRGGSQGGSTSSSNLLPPNEPGNTNHTPTGAIVMGHSGVGSGFQSWNAEPSSLLSNRGDDRPGNGGNRGNSYLGSDPHSQNDDEQSLGNGPSSQNGGGQSLGSGPSSQNGGSGALGSDSPLFASSTNGLQPNNQPLLGGSSGKSGATPFGADPAPEPTSLTLLAVGGVGLLMGRLIRRNRRAV